MGNNLEKRVKSPIMIKVSKKHIDKYIALAPFNNRKIVAYGKGE